MIVADPRKCVVYYKIFTELNRIVYVGKGSLNRAHKKHRESKEFNRLVDLGFIHTEIDDNHGKFYTEGEALYLEKVRINEIGIEHLFNRQGKDTNIDIDKEIEKDMSILAYIAKEVESNISIVERSTPDKIATNMIDKIINTSNFSIKGKKILNPVMRTGKFYKMLVEKFGLDNMIDNFTGIEEDKNKLILFHLINSMGVKMHNVKLIEGNFDKWDTDEEYDLIFMNPPFKKYGEKFIMKCIDYLKPGGFLSIVINPTWRSITTKIGKKSYYKLLQKGGFHYIHMYSAEETKELFNQAIGQVDVFVWQKGAKITNTQIVNQRGDRYEVDLNRYPQAPPVLPSYIYDEYFDQVNGRIWDWFSNLKSNLKNDPANKVYKDFITGKKFTTNNKNIERTSGKKVYLDPMLNKYIIDNKGDHVTNVNPMYFFNNKKERESIIKAMEFVMENKDLFKTWNGRKCHAYVPAIRIN